MNIANWLKVTKDNNEPSRIANNTEKEITSNENNYDTMMKKIDIREYKIQQKVRE